MIGWIRWEPSIGGHGLREKLWTYRYQLMRKSSEKTQADLLETNR